jgi:hypothetical protein
MFKTAIAICSTALFALALLAGEQAFGDEGELSSGNYESNRLNAIEYDADAVVESTADGTIISYEAATSAAFGGAACHADYITVPDGTTMSNWVLLVAPRSMGRAEAGSEKDNALLLFNAYATVINQYTWQIRARYKYRFGGDRDGVYRDGCVNYALISR